MATIAHAQGTPEIAAKEVNYLNVEHGWKSWLFTTDHKRIAVLYLISITLMFFVGGSMAVLFRINLLEPQGIFAPETYNRLFSAHGIIMVFFFLVPSIPATLANFLIPIMVGAKDLAFPRINLLSWYLYVIGAFLTMFAVLRGGVDTGWTFYTPYSSTYSNSYVLAAAFGVFTAGFSSILTGLNFIVTVHKMRAPGMTWSRLPLFVWSNYATGLIQVLGTPVLAIVLLLLAFERIAHVGIFDPSHWRRSDSLPASVLVLFASRGLHHDSARHGSDQRNRGVLFAKTGFRVQLRGLLEHGDRGSQLRRLGPPHVYYRREYVHQHRLFIPEFHGRGSVSYQSLQLDGDDV